MYQDRAKALASLIAEAQRKMGQAPESVVRELRGKRPLREVAMKSGMSEAQLSRIENGQRELTADSARKLAPVLGVDEATLWSAAGVSRLSRAAQKGELDPEALLDVIREIAFSVPDSELGERLTEALLAVLGEALQTWDEAEAQEEAVRAAVEEQVGPAAVAAKSARKRPRNPARDAHGRRIDKPYGGSQR